MKEIQLENNMKRETWLALRRHGIGGSDASVTCGQNRYRSPIELWLDKTGKLPAKDDTEAIYWGHTMEPIIRKEFEQRSGLSVTTPPVMYQHDRYSFMLANLDGIVHDPQLGNCVFEAKTASAFKASEWTPQIPVEYYLQVQHYMAVTEFPGAYIAALIGGNQFLWKFIPRDEDTIAFLIQKEAEFWEYVKSDTIPPVDGSEATQRILQQLYPQSEADSVINLSEDAMSLICLYEEAVSEETSAKAKKELAVNQLKQMLGTKETGVIGERKVIWKTMTSQRFDTKAFQEAYPKGYVKFLRKMEARRFSIK